MKRLVVALSLAVAATAVQAQTAGDRVLHPSNDNPSLVTAVKSWLASKMAPSTAPTPAPKTAPKTAAQHAVEPRRHVAVETRQRSWHHARHDKVTDYKVSEADVAPKDAAPKDAAPKAAVTDVPAAPPAPAPSAAPTMTTASAEPVGPAVEPPPAANPNMPRTVATITVLAPSASPARPHHGRSECTSGERIITAFYWEGKHTASGARFEPDGMTAAHRTFPFGTKLVVINPRNGKSVTVTVNDRGPFVKGVTLDLSRGAARAIGVQGNAAVCMAKM